MIQFDVRPQGFDRAMSWLRRGVNLERVIGDELGAWAGDHLDGELYGMENYAPPPPNSTYIRTGRLGANWGLARRGRSSVVFNNMTPYAGYVVGNSKGYGQAAAHVGRWWLARKRTEAAIPTAQRRIRARIHRELWR